MSTEKESIYKLYSSLPTLMTQKVRTEIDISALQHNYRVLSSYVKGRTLPVCVIKADAYGHGADFCASALLAEGCRMFAVSGIEEAMAVRRACGDRYPDTKILILGYTPPREVPNLIRYRIIQACFSEEYAGELSTRAVGECGGKLHVHLKFDTGMNRIGFAAHSQKDMEITTEQVKRVAALPGLSVDGAFSHFARADDDTAEGDALTVRQAERFLTVTEKVIAAGVPLPMRHICNSAAAVRFPEYHLDGCRLGILIYGIMPSGAVDIPLKPVLKLKTLVSQVHILHSGESVGYGGTFTADREMTLATLPIGYADGFIRAYSGAKGLIKSPDGKVKGTGTVVGRICMDQCMMDVSGLDVRAGDEVTLIGEVGQLDELARLAGTINYECLCLISARVPRIAVNAD